MPRYYFDMREGDEIVPDDEGLELDAIRKHSGAGHHRQMAIDVRDDSGPVLQVTFTFTFTIDRRSRH